MEPMVIWLALIIAFSSLAFWMRSVVFTIIAVALLTMFTEVMLIALITAPPLAALDGRNPDLENYVQEIRVLSVGRILTTCWVVGSLCFPCRIRAWCAMWRAQLTEVR